MRTRPLPGLCAAFAAGILLAWSAGWAVWLVALFAAILLWYGLGRRRGPIITAGLLLLLATLGAARFAIGERIPADDVSRLPSTALTLTGVVSGDPAITDDGSTDEPLAERIVVVAQSARLDSAPDRPIPISGAVAARLFLTKRGTRSSLSAAALPHDGDTVELRGRLERPDGPRNPGGYDYRAALARRGIYATFTVSGARQVQVLQRAAWTNPYFTLAYGLRHAVETACRRALPGQRGGVLTAILIGDHSSVPPAVEEDFERTGTIHLLATAGLHVGIVVWLLTRALRHSGVARRPALVAAICALALYAVMAGERAAVLRAVIVAGVCLFGDLVEREPHLPSALAFAALALLVANPNDLFDPGFQLSFATVTTIALTLPLLKRIVEPVDRPIRDGTASAKLTRKVVRYGAALLAMAVAAQLGSAPLVARYFYDLSLVSIPANVLAVPAAFLAIALGFPMALLYHVHPWLATPLVSLLRLLISYLLGAVHNCAALPFAARNVAPPSPLWIAGYYACLWSFAWWAGGSAGPAAVTAKPMATGHSPDDRAGDPDSGAIGTGGILATGPERGYGASKPESATGAAVGPGATELPLRRTARRLALTSGIAVLALGLWGFVAPRPRELRVTFLDVGQGDACVLESPSGKVLVVDTGGTLHDVEDDQGRRVVAPYLRYRGLNAIDAVVLTHPHLDHIGGAVTLLRDFPTRELMDDGVDEEKPQVSRITGEEVRDGGRVLLADEGRRFDFGDGVTADVLAPADVTPGEGPNNASVVLRVTFGRTVFLLTGDAETPEEHRILAAGEPLACDVLKVGHHGSRTSTSPPFLAAAHPRIAVISVGRRNMYNHPSPEVVERLADSGARVLRTDEDGAVTCRSDGVTVKVETMAR